MEGSHLWLPSVATNLISRFSLRVGSCSRRSNRHSLNAMMKRTPQELRRAALAIWTAGVEAVRSDLLVRQNVHLDGQHLHVCEQVISLDGVQRIVVVGGGKAGAGMATGLEEALSEKVMAEKHLDGWVNVPADCASSTERIKLHAARPAGVNEPTEAGIEGTNRILELVQSLSRSDLCICLLSGGGSALLPAPVPGISLEDKQEITRHLSAAGANIQQLNTVRKKLSLIKGGGLANACRAGHLITLIISDVIGDPLDIIASGPTVDDPSTAVEALEILEHFEARKAGISSSVFELLQRKQREESNKRTDTCKVSNYVIGNNETAVIAAGIEAQRRGYVTELNAAGELEGEAEEVGRRLAEAALRMRHEAGPDCLISGGEPTVKLVAEKDRGLGGRNQQLALAALERVWQAYPKERSAMDGLALLSGGTDGEDGPTDAAGAVIDSNVERTAEQNGLKPADFLLRNDAYHFFEMTGGLFKTGPTHTNVCDVRVVLVESANVA